MKFKFFILSSLVFLLFSCKTQIKTLRPDENYVSPRVENKLSSVALNIDIDILALEKSLNKSLKGVIYEDKNFEDDHLEVRVTQTSDINFTVLGNKITAVLPLKIWTKTGYRKELFGLKAESYYEAHGEMLAVVSMVFGIDKDWTLGTTTSIDKYQWTKKPFVTAAGVDIPVTTIADLTLLTLKKKISKEVDKALAQKIDFPSLMQKTWNDLQEPIQLDAQHNIWLKVKPKAICTSPILGQGSRLKFDVTLDSYVETTVGFKPAAHAKTKLPPYKTAECILPVLNLHSNIAVSYSKLEQLAKTMLVGQEFVQSGKKVKIDSVHFYGQKDFLVVQLAVSGSANGTIYCIGKPYYDKSTRMLKVKDFDFELETKNSLIKTANWLMHKEFLNKIKPMLDIPLGGDIDALISTGNSQLKNYPLYKGVTLKGRLSNISLADILITKHAIVVGGEIEGYLRLELKDLF